MKKKNLFFLLIVCLLSLSLLAGLLVRAFATQAEKDRQEGLDSSLSDSSDDPATEAPTASPTQTPVTPTGSIESPSEATDPSLDSSGNDSSQVQPSVSPSPAEDNATGTETIVLAFAGDVNFDEDSYPVKKYDAEGGDITACLSEDLLAEMNAADIMMLNNEFAYSTRGVEETDKSYTFRADPSRVGILKEMGVDIVSLANNHSLDFGPDALLDTFDTLEGAAIDYVGAGENIDRAKAPIYYDIDGRRIAFLAATRIIPFMDWYASDTELGVVGTYDPALIVESIKEAEANSDFVVIFVHWGVERENYPVQYQRDLAKAYIDAGADAVIGCHPHVLQGFEFYKGKPIAYSLGNYWFNNSTRETGLLKLHLDPDGTVRTQLLPAMGKNTYTYLLTDEGEKRNYFDFMESISYDTVIDEEGFITLKE